MGRDGEWFAARAASSRVHVEGEGASGTAGRSRWRGVDGLGQNAVACSSWIDIRMWFVREAKC